MKKKFMLRSIYLIVRQSTTSTTWKDSVAATKKNPTPPPKKKNLLCGDADFNSNGCGAYFRIHI